MIDEMMNMVTRAAKIRTTAIETTIDNVSRSGNRAC
jgi:hypothetical protein